jgi:hypothetical protein
LIELAPDPTRTRCLPAWPPCLPGPLQELEPDTVALMAKRVYDVAGVLGKGSKVGWERGW